MMLSTGASVDSRMLSAALKRRVDGFWIGAGRICQHDFCCQFDGSVRSIYEASPTSARVLANKLCQYFCPHPRLPSDAVPGYSTSTQHGGVAVSGVREEADALCLP